MGRALGRDTPSEEGRLQAVVRAGAAERGKCVRAAVERTRPKRERRRQQSRHGK